MTAHPFDVIAQDYDTTFTHRALGKMLRALVWEHLQESFHPGDQVMDLGCGSGEDAVWLAQQNVHVIGVDVSSVMIAVAQEKAATAGVEELTDFVNLDLLDFDGYTQALASASGAQQTALDGAYANFGALNCLPDRRPFGQVIADQLRPGATLILVLMGPTCPWEIGWYLVHGKLRTAFRRWRRSQSAKLAKGETIQVWYPSPAKLRSELAPHFMHIKTIGVGVLLPPSYLGHLVDRKLSFFERLYAWEKRLAGSVPGQWLNDHYLSIFKRK